MKGTRVLLAVSALLVSGVDAMAHHSFTATYDENATVQIEGQMKPSIDRV
jgi:hypothetical protein